MKRSFTRNKAKPALSIVPKESTSAEPPRPKEPLREFLSKLSRLALLYASEESAQLPTIRMYRDQILAGEIPHPHARALPEERWVLQLGFRRLDEAWVDAELYRLTNRKLLLKQK